MLFLTQVRNFIVYFLPRNIISSNYNVKRGTEHVLFLLNNYLMIYTSLRHLYTKYFIKSKNHFSATSQFLRDIFSKFQFCINIH